MRQKMKICWLGCLGALLLAALPAVGMEQENYQNKNVANILAKYDPGFDFPDKTSTWKKRWGSVVRDTAVKHSGRQSLRIDAGGELESTLKIKVEPGYQYYFSAWGKIKNFNFVKAGKYGCGFGMEELRADGSVNGNWYNMNDYLKYKEGDEDWSYVEMMRVPKDTTVWLRPVLKCVAVPGSIAWYDDMRIWKVKLPEKKSEQLVNIVENPSFEIRYNMDLTPFGFELSLPDGSRANFGKEALTTQDEKSLQAASLKLNAPCTVKSSPAEIDGDELNVRVSAMSKGMKDGAGKVKVDFLDAQHKLVDSVEIASVTGDQPWKTFEHKIKLSELKKKPQYAQMVIRRDKDGNGAVYFDDLQILSPTTLVAMPTRPKNTSTVNVSVNCGKSGKVFTSPLDAYDHHCADRVHSYSIGTAGPHLEGPGRWHDMRRELGVKYVRIHSGYNGNGLCEHLKVDGKTKFGWDNGEHGVIFGNPRTNYPEGDKIFPPVCQINKSGEMITDFSSIKHYLDHAILIKGVKPIFGLEPVPRCLAWDSDPHYKPNNMKLWEEFNYRFIKFLVDTYGADEIKTWIFETGNEPGTEPTFHGRPGRPDVTGDFLEMHDYTVAGCRRALPEIFIAGPSGPPEHIMMALVKHCAEGKNFATGEIGGKLDAISYHGYLGGSVNDLSWRSAEELIFRFLRYRDYYEKKTGKKLALFNTEFAAIYSEVTPKNPPEGNYDNHIQAIATLHMANFSYRLGVELMAFFYGSPVYFAPVRNATGFKKSSMQSNTPEFIGEPTMITFHGIFKPVTRVYQMMSWLNGGNELEAKADCEPIFALATRKDREVKILCYSFDVDPSQKYVTSAKFKVGDIDAPGTRYSVTRYELSADKANSWYLATKDKITQEQCEKSLELVDRINRESELQPEKLGTLTVSEKRDLSFNMKVPAFSASLLVLTPEK